MQQILALVFATLVAGGAAAQDVVAAESAAAPAPRVAEEAPLANVVPDAPEAKTLAVLDASEVTLDQFQWIARPVVVFANTPADPRFQEQIQKLLERPEPLIERDVVIIMDTDPAARSEVRLALRPRGFMLVLIDKDGTVNLRKPAPWDVRELTRAIDKMPSRQQEIRQEKVAGG